VNYDEYIRSDAWKSRAAKARRRAGDRCQVCNSDQRPLHVHHRTYERLGNEKPHDLTALCAECHALFHNRVPKESQIDRAHRIAAQLARTPRAQ
jgi:5-methylcytosine-specific restriction endonuclease McrA